MTTQSFTAFLWIFTYPNRYTRLLTSLSGSSFPDICHIIAFILVPNDGKHEIKSLNITSMQGALRYSSLLGVIFSSYLCFIAVVKYFGFCLDSANVEIADKGYYNKQVVQCFWKPKPINSSKIGKLGRHV